MPLAGRMKLKHFVALVVGVVGAGSVVLFMGGAAVVKSIPERPKPPTKVVSPAPAPFAVQTPEVVEAPAPAPEAPPADGLRDVDRVVFGYQGQNLGSSKKKDVTKGRPYKVNVYQDDGHTSANRAKIDLDRDDQWDEKWTFSDSGVQRKIAPADDENYTEVVLFVGGEWVPEG